jgi:hypothetical protein
VLPTANLLLLASPKLSKGNATKSFRFGFEAVGWAMVLVFGHLAWHHPQTLFWPIDALDRKRSFRRLGCQLSTWPPRSRLSSSSTRPHKYSSPF